MMLLKRNKVIRIVIDPNMGADRWPTLREAASVARISYSLLDPSLRMIPRPGPSSKNISAS